MARDIIWDTELVLPDTTIRFVSIVDILNFVVYYRLLVHWVWLKITHSHWKWHSLIVHSCGTCCWCFIQTVSLCCNVCWDVATYRWKITGTLLLLRMLWSVSSHSAVTKNAVVCLFFFPTKNLHSLYLTRNERDWIETITQCSEWSQFMVDYLLLWQSDLLCWWSLFIKYFSQQWTFALTASYL